MRPQKVLPQKTGLVLKKLRGIVTSEDCKPHDLCMQAVQPASARWWLGFDYEASVKPADATMSLLPVISEPVMKPIFLVAVLAWPATALAEVPALCADAPNQMEGTACATNKLASANGALSQAYDALASKLDPLGRHNLDRAQSAWLTYRDLECNLETGYDAEHVERNGTIMPMLFGECAVDLTERRIRQLQEQLKCPGGDLSCTR